MTSVTRQLKRKLQWLLKVSKQRQRIRNVFQERLWINLELLDGENNKRFVDRKKPNGLKKSTA